MRCWIKGAVIQRLNAGCVGLLPWHRCSSGVAPHCRVPQRHCSSGVAPHWKILFFGSDDFSLPHLNLLREHQLNGRLVKSLSVITMKNNRLIRRCCREHGLDCHVWPASADQLKKFNFDLGVLVSFGRLVPEDIISAFPKGVVNIHPSLLPRWQGAAPLLHTVLSGDRETGVSLMKLQPHRFDCGPVIVQRKSDVDMSFVTSEELRTVMAGEGAKMLTTFLSDVDKYLSQETEQDPTKATAAPKLQLSHAGVNWNDSMEQIDRQYRTLGSVFQLRSQFNDLHCRLLEMEPLANMDDVAPSLQKYNPGRQFQPGEACFLRKRELLCIKCQDGWVAFKHIAVKKPLTARGFYNGYLSKHKHLRFQSLEHGLEKFQHWKDRGCVFA